MLAALMGLWAPKEGDKCDYKPKGMGEEAYFVMAKVVSVNGNAKNTKLDVSYFLDGAPKTETVDYPSDIIQECGAALVARTDCKEEGRRRRRM